MSQTILKYMIGFLIVWIILSVLSRPAEKRRKQRLAELTEYMRIQRPQRLSNAYPGCTYTTHYDLSSEGKRISDSYALDMIKEYDDYSIVVKHRIYCHEWHDQYDDANDDYRRAFGNRIEFAAVFHDGHALTLPGQMNTSVKSIVFHAASQIFGSLKEFMNGEKDEGVYKEAKGHGRVRFEGNDFELRYYGFTGRQWDTIVRTGALDSIERMLTLWSQQKDIGIRFHCNGGMPGFLVSDNQSKEETLASECLKKDYPLENAELINQTMEILSAITVKLASAEALM